jgi:hypothetical protein
MARRIEISRCRAAARASSMLDRFTHASIRMSATIPISTRSGRPTLSRNGLKPSGAASAMACWRRRLARSFSGACELCAWTNDANSTCTSAFASSTVAPGFSRASMFNQLKSFERYCGPVAVFISNGSVRSGT